MLTRDSPIRSKRFSFKPNYVQKSSQFADASIVSTLMTLGDKLRNHKFCEQAVIATNNNSAEFALKWILQGMSKSKHKYTTTPRITQSTTCSSPVLVAISPKPKPQNNNLKKDKNSISPVNTMIDDLMECALVEDSHRKPTYASPPPLSIGKSSYNEEDEIVSPTTITITRTPNNSNSRTTTILSQTLLSKNPMQIHTNIGDIDEQEIILMSPVTPYTPSVENRLQSPTFFEMSHALRDKSVNILNVYEHNLNVIFSFLCTKDRIMCSLLCQFMNALVMHNCNFDDIWLTFGGNNAWNNGENMQLIMAKSISDRYYKNCVNVSMECIQFVSGKSSDNLMNFNNIHTRNRSHGKSARPRFHAKKMDKYINEKRLSSIELNDCWIWKYLHNLELNSTDKIDGIFNSLEWSMLCKTKLSKSIYFLSFDMKSNVFSPDNFNLIPSYFPNLRYLNILNWDIYHPKHKDIILEFFKLRHNFDDSGLSGHGWEKVETSLIKLKGIELNNTNPKIVKLLANNVISNYSHKKLMIESLFTQLITLSIHKCQLLNIAHLQIILNGCVSLKYLSLVEISVSDANMNHIISSDRPLQGRKFTDRVERHKQVRQSMSQSKHYEMERFNGVPIIKVPKTVKYLKISHSFNDTLIDNGYEEEEYEELDEFSTNSTPVLFAMDDIRTNSPKKKPKQNKNKNKMKIYPLSVPPFYCNLSQCREKLIEANVQINDAYTVNQLFLSNIRSLKQVILNYSCAEHNRYLNFSSFCELFPNHYQRWDKLYSKNIKIALNNSLYDEFKLSVNRIKCEQFFNRIFNKNEVEIMKEERLLSLPQRLNIKKSKTENQFINRLVKSTDFFHSTLVNL